MDQKATSAAHAEDLGGHSHARISKHKRLCWAKMLVGLVVGTVTTLCYPTKSLADTGITPWHTTHVFRLDEQTRCLCSPVNITVA